MIHPPELDRPDIEWLNTNHPLDLKMLRGRLVLLDPARKLMSSLDSAHYVCADDLCLHNSEPAGVFCMPGQDLMLVDTNNHRVLVYNFDRQESMTWSPPQSCSGLKKFDCTCPALGT